MSFAEMQYYGNGRIICDTSTFSVGDKIRVKSMVDNTKIWDKTVATVGTPLVYDVPCKDYYKICIVQTISNVETEIGGIYRTLDYGQTIWVNTLNKSTLGGIQSILNAHQELDVLNIGDEVTISINNDDWVMQIAGIDLYDSHEAILISKNIWNLSAVNQASDGSYWNATTSFLETQMTSFFNAMKAEEQNLLKLVTKNMRKAYNSNTWSTFTAKVYPVNNYEIFGVNGGGGTPSLPMYQFPLFATQADRVKEYNNTATGWWTCDGSSSGQKNYLLCTETGSSDSAIGNANSSSVVSKGVVPCFTLRADS